MTLTAYLNAGTAHAGHDHPATKAGRAKCRRDAARRDADRRDSLTALIDSYYEGADLESIAAQCPRHLAQGYYDNSLDAEEFIAILRAVRDELA